MGINTYNVPRLLHHKQRRHSDRGFDFEQATEYLPLVKYRITVVARDAFFLDDIFPVILKPDAVLTQKLLEGVRLRLELGGTLSLACLSQAHRETLGVFTSATATKQRPRCLPPQKSSHHVQNERLCTSSVRPAL